MDDVLLVILCELGERILATREVLAEPSLTARPQARAVTALLGAGLDAVEERVERTLAGPAREPRSAAGGMPAALHALADCSSALDALHSRLGLLDMRWNAAPVDMFLRKLRDDVGELPPGGLPLRGLPLRHPLPVGLPHPAVVLSDEGIPDHDVAARLGADLAAVGLVVTPEAAGEGILALPRGEAGRPLAWPLLCFPLARLCLRRGLVAGPQPDADVDDGVAGLLAVGLGGPAAFAARAADALARTPAGKPVWPALGPLADAALAYAGELEERHGAEEGFDAVGPVTLLARLARARDEILGHGAAGFAGPRPGPWQPPLPPPAVPTRAEMDVLLDKLVAGIPINAIAPPVPDDFLSRLEGMASAADFYALIAPLGERTASLAAILVAGWLYKARRSYPLFRDLWQAHRRLQPALAAYRPHVMERDLLLVQSIEAAHVHGIFARSKVEV